MPTRRGNSWTARRGSDRTWRSRGSGSPDDSGATRAAVRTVRRPSCVRTSRIVGLRVQRVFRRTRGVAALAVGAAIVLSSCGGSPGPSISTTPSATRSAPVSSPPKRSIPPRLGLQAFSFPSPAYGFALGDSCASTGADCRPQIIATTDGGSRWHAVNAPPASRIQSGASSCVGDNSVSEIAFANRADGWTWGPGLWATQDGARSWHEVKTLGPVRSLAVVGGRVWAVESDCTSSGGSPNRNLVVMRAPLGGGAWTTVPGLPSVLASSAALEATPSGLVWLEATGTSAGGGGTTVSLFRTADAGASWSSLTDPCSPVPGSTPPFAVIGEAVWIACGGEPGAGNQSKIIYTSSDGGQIWSRAASSGQVGVTPEPSTGTIPIAGYVAGLAVTSSSVGWLALARGTLLVSRDSGHLWTQAIPAAAAAGGSGVLAVAFATPTDGWALASPDSGGETVIYRTTVGGSAWTAVPLS